jgi:hypothetical protein
VRRILLAPRNLVAYEEQTFLDQYAKDWHWKASFGRSRLIVADAARPITIQAIIVVVAVEREIEKADQVTVSVDFQQERVN